MLPFYKKELKCKQCGKDITIRTFFLWRGHKVNDEYYCDDCYKKLKEEQEQEQEQGDNK